MKTKSIVWFRNDLRLKDNATLVKAIDESSEVIPIYVFDPLRWRKHDLGFIKTGVYQTQFLLESVKALKESLKQKGSDLLLLHGDPSVEIKKFAKANGVSGVYLSKETTWEEVNQEKRLERSLDEIGSDLHSVWQSTLFHENDIPWPTQFLPDIFTKFRKENEKATPIYLPLDAPSKINSPVLPKSDIPSLRELGFHDLGSTPDQRRALAMNGGEPAAWIRLNHYFWETDQLKNYKWTRNELLGASYSSKLSPWLAHGCISPRSIHAEVKRYERERISNTSTYWLIFELIWRDYFRFVCKKFGARVFHPSGIRGEKRSFKHDKDLFAKWIKGETGIPFIDANMRELLHTGFMSNRGRQNVASFLVKDLNIDWRWGASWFESQLIDYDVCSNWGNWMYVAGVGNDPRENRYFNIMSQALKYDAKGEYVRQWLPELKGITGGKIHLPSALSEEQRELGDIKLGNTYPEPIVDPRKWN